MDGLMNGKPRRSGVTDLYDSQCTTLLYLPKIQNFFPNLLSENWEIVLWTCLPLQYILYGYFP